MSLSDGAWATLLVGLFALIQWAITERARTRRRDTEMVHWGGAVIDLMASLEAQCEFPDPCRDVAKFRSLAAAASALVDRGRLFFPNVTTAQPTGISKPQAYRGFRVALLDEVVRAYFMANHLADPDNAILPGFKSEMRDARRRFVSGLQAEMGRTLRESSREKVGVSVPADPRRW